MNNKSREVSSSQEFFHPGLASVVTKQLSKPSRRPPAGHTVTAFEALRPRVEASEKPLIFDSYCGTGMSTALLADQHPGHLVIGIDQSAHRLARHAPGPSANYRLVRADCGDLWRLALNAGWRLEKHFILYPNPWPKSGHLQRRVHASQDFPALLALGGALELRSNWQTYVEECGIGLHLAGFTAAVSEVPGGDSISLFETKYRQSGHTLWRCCCKLDSPRP